jgi:hypothetical protein
METTWSDRWETDCVAKLRDAGYLEAWSGGGDLLLELTD